MKKVAHKIIQNGEEIKNLMFENAVLKAKLAKYEQQEAAQNVPPRQEVIPNGQIKEI